MTNSSTDRTVPAQSPPGSTAAAQTATPAPASAAVQTATPAPASAAVPAAFGTAAAPGSVRFGEHVLRGDRAGLATTARFDVDLRHDVVTSTIATRQAAARASSQAHAAGYAAGWAEGRRAADQAARVEAERAAAQARAAIQAATIEQAVRVEQAITALAAAAGRLDRRATPDLTELEQTVVAAAFLLAESVIGRELAIAQDPGADAIARALAAAPAAGPVTVRLHPADLVTVAETSGGSGQYEVNGRTVSLIPDPRLSPGDAIAECDATTVEARVSTAVDRIREVLFGAAQ